MTVGIDESREQRALDSDLADLRACIVGAGATATTVAPQLSHGSHPGDGVPGHLDRTGPKDRHRPGARHDRIGHVAHSLFTR